VKRLLDALYPPPGEHTKLNIPLMFAFLAAVTVGCVLLTLAGK
jgi:hypothetical protein